MMSEDDSTRNKATHSRSETTRQYGVYAQSDTDRVKVFILVYRSVSFLRIQCLEKRVTRGLFVTHLAENSPRNQDYCTDNCCYGQETEKA